MCDYLKGLQRPFPAEDIEWRVSHATKGQSGAKALVLAYVTNRAIMERLDEVFGIAGWKNDYSEWRDKGVKCTLTCKINDEWIAKEDGADVTDMEATKGGFSASMKRAAVQWGIGRYLYNLEQVWVPVKDKGQNYIKTQTKQREEIKGYWDTPKLPQWALPEGYEPKEPRAQEEHAEAPNDLPEPPPEEPNQPDTSPTTQPHSNSDRMATEGQTRMLYAKIKQTGWLDFSQINDFLGYNITKFAEVKAADVTKLAQFLDRNKAA